MAMTIFFDFDGTLVRVADRFHAVYAEICREMGLESLSKTEYWEARRQGRSTREILVRTNGESSYTPFITKRTKLIESRRFLAFDTLKDGAVELLETLNERHELQLVSMRNSRENLMWQLDLLGIGRLFAGIRTASAFGSFADKAALLSDAGAVPHRDLIIGDTDLDIKAGQSVGLATCAVLDGMRTATVLARLSPNFMVNHLREIIPLFSQGFVGAESCGHINQGVPSG